ncbi:CZB domain-containing protein, partial [Bacteroidota bacterium]
MNWKNIKLGGKFSIAFGIIIFILMAVAIWSIFGIGNIVNNAEKAIEGNILRTELEHKHVQHLQWASEINKFLIDDKVNELNIQTNYHDCDFGKWYYGEGKKHLEELAPELNSILAKFEEPHIKLHESAIKIKNQYINADENLSIELREAKSAHLLCLNNISNNIFNEDFIINKYKNNAEKAIEGNILRTELE